MTDGPAPTLRARSGSRFLGSGPGAPVLPSLPALQTAGFDADVLAVGARAWTLRAEEEYRSAAIFAELTAALAGTGLPLDLTGAAAATVVDELGHAALCIDLAARLGAPLPTVNAEPVAARVASHPTPRRRALALALVEGAIGETISSALFNAGRHATQEPCSRAALAHIARDEAHHARRFWELMRAVPLDDADRAHLQAEAQHAFGHLERGLLPALRRLEAGESFNPALGALGVLAPERRVETFYGAVERAVRPRLDALGLDGDGAWARRYAAL